MMIKKIVLFFLFFIILISFLAIADTGTYQIVDYRIKLTPKSDGMVEIEYYQKWLVTGGHIPWITIGTANSSYQIDQGKNLGNIRRIYTNNSSGWSGVRIDLDKDYLPNQTFEVGFTLIQSRLFYADKENYKLEFTPGWYDRAVTERLVVVMHVFAPIDKVIATPRPIRIDSQEIIWERHNLGRGSKFPVSISFPKTFMPNVNTSALKSRRASRGSSRFLGYFIIFWIIGVFLALIVVLRSRGYGSGGSLFVAGSGRGGRSTGGGGGFGGRSSSCACACVSCACACACAGGGGAGCSKKNSHSCPICIENKKEI